MEDEYDKGEGDVVEEGDEEECEEEEDEDEGEDDERSPEGSSSGSPRDGRTHPFILPAIWTINNFNLMMTTKIFKNLLDHYQIPKNIPIICPGNSKSVTLGRPRTLACMTPCLRRH